MFILFVEAYNLTFTVSNGYPIKTQAIPANPPAT